MWDGDAEDKMLGTSKNTGASPALMSSLHRSGLRELEEALGRLFPWSLWEKGKYTELSTKAKAVLFLCQQYAKCDFWRNHRALLMKWSLALYYRILINLWFSAEIYLLKTSQICLTIQNMVTRNNKINPKFTVQTKKADEGSIPQEVTVRIRKNSAVLEFKKPSFQEASFTLRCTRAAGKKTVLLDQMNPGIIQGCQIWNPGLIMSNPLLFPPNRYLQSLFEN